MKKPILVLKVRIKGEIYDRIYGIEDLEHVVELFNDIHADGMRVSIEEVEVHNHEGSEE